MASNDYPRPLGNTPVTDASAATAPDETQKYGSNTDLRVAEDDHLRDAAMTATGADIDNDHADDAQQGDTAQHDDDSQQGGGQHKPSE